MRLPWAQMTILLTEAFISDYSHPAGEVDWPKLVYAACGNYDLDRFSGRLR